MGHNELPYLQMTRPWEQVLALLDEGADVDAIASAAVDAAEKGFKQAANDMGFKYTVWLLTQVTLAAKKADFSGELSTVGVDVTGRPRSI